MEQNEKKRKIADCLSCLPRKILDLHGQENVIEFVLHELGREDCFNLEKAAYIIDNPDFNTIKGVAGFDRSEAFQGENIWKNPIDFSKHMSNSSYNKKIRGFHKPSCIKKNENNEKVVNEIAHDLGFDHPLFYSWNMKYDNHGLLLYEKHDTDECDCDYLLEGLSLIGFCPIF